MNFRKLETEDELATIQSINGYCVIFKHNTTCPISRATRIHFEKEADLLPVGTPVYFLDLLSFRDLSNAIADKFQVRHESPQVLLIKDGKCIYNQSHYDISAGETAAAINQG
ncbi:bacillithiol system redox-active protein YtxJ [Desertivirga arenae]|uniref:bacillithiol system redox-active protein YtxJ n=1 Tax=Desertivirga arenae TaxID=2810309 RepID=UPI001A964227|nr:bacillithiol system redox-active protein YtxJ [Pedobacter sp. SYSU D00823]